MLHFLLLLIALQDQTPALTPEVAATVEKGNEALRAGDYAEAIEIFGALRQSLPEHPGPRLNLGLALYLSGNPSEAIQHLKGIAGFPGLEMAWLFLGSSYLQSGQKSTSLPDPMIRRDGGLWRMHWPGKNVRRRLSCNFESSPS